MAPWGIVPPKAEVAMLVGARGAIEYEPVGSAVRNSSKNTTRWKQHDSMAGRCD